MYIILQSCNLLKTDFILYVIIQQVIILYVLILLYFSFDMICDYMLHHIIIVCICVKVSTTVSWYYVM